MPTSLTGTSRKTYIASKTAGFTLFELVLVIFIVSLASAMVMPSFWQPDDRVLKKESKRIANTLRYIYDEATGKKTAYIITFNLDDASWSFKSDKEQRQYTLKNRVVFESITVPSLGAIPAGELVMEVSPLGPAEPIVILLSKEELYYTVVLNHLNGRAKIYEGEISLE